MINYFISEKCIIYGVKNNALEICIGKCVKIEAISKTRIGENERGLSTISIAHESVHLAR